MNYPVVTGRLRLEDWIEPFYETSNLEVERYNEVQRSVKRIIFDGLFGMNIIHREEGVGITYTWRLAKNCYIKGIWAGTIQFASSTVERAFNLDSRMQLVRAKQQSCKRKNASRSNWLMLNRTILQEAKKRGLPVETLLGDSESLEVGIIKFIERRNKIAHGDYNTYMIPVPHKFPNDQHFTAKLIADTKLIEDAKDQFTKCSAFIEAWILQNPCIEGLFD